MHTHMYMCVCMCIYIYIYICIHMFKMIIVHLMLKLPQLLPKSITTGGRTRRVRVFVPAAV